MLTLVYNISATLTLWQVDHKMLESKDNENEMSIGFVLRDDDMGDEFMVDVFLDPKVTSFPVFRKGLANHLLIYNVQTQVRDFCNQYYRGV